MDKNILNKIKDELGKVNAFLFADEGTATIPEDEIKGEIKPGEKIERIMSDQTIESIADGEYKIGEKTVVVKDGLIESVDGEKAPEKEEPAKEEAMEDATDYQKAIDEINAKLEEMQKQIDELKGVNETVTKQNEEMKTAFKNIHQAFSKIPAESSKIVLSDREIQAKKKEESMDRFIQAFKVLK